MPLINCGLNHKTAPLAVREKLSLAGQDLHLRLCNLTQTTSIDEAVILSTCNRTEFICYADDHGEELRSWVLKEFSEEEPLDDSLYCFHSREAFSHTLRVASGLDSMILGEPQILGQLKQAYQISKAGGYVGSHLQRLFQYIFKVTKQVRTETEVGANPVSISYAAVQLAKQIFADVKNTSVLLIGAGETIELVGRYLKENGVKQIRIANRTTSRAEQLAEFLSAQTLALGNIPAYLADCDIVISATSSPLPILGKGSVEQALRVRKHKPMFMVDLAVPRDIEKQVAELEDVYLYTVDDLQGIVDDSLSGRQEAAIQAEEMIQAHAIYYQRWLKSLDAVSTIRQFRHRLEAVRDEELTLAFEALEKGASPELVVARLARCLTNKIMHNPTLQMREASSQGQLEILGTVKRLFALKEDELT